MNANLEQFAYVASHDLQEPLPKIQSLGDVLQNNYGNLISGDGADLIVRMQTAANRMAGLIRDLLAYSRLSTHRDGPEEVSLQTVVSRVLDDLDLSVQETGAVIHTGHLPVVPASPSTCRFEIQSPMFKV